LGTVYWLTGLSGSGKTTIAKELYNRLKFSKSNVIFLDGDTLREVLGNTGGHSLEDRKKLAMVYSRLCKVLSEQGFDVICSTISLFKEVHEYNRNNIKNYYEIFIECDMNELIRRDQKGIYSKALRGEIKDVIGINLPYDKPLHPSLVIDNSEKNDLDKKVDTIINLELRR